MESKRLSLSLFLGVLIVAGCSSGSRRVSLTGFENHVPKVVISPDGTTVATVSRQEVKLWNASNGQSQASIPTPAVDLAFAPDGRILATASSRSILLWDVNTGEKRRELELIRETPAEQTGDQVQEKNQKVAWEIQHIAFSADGKSLAASSGFGGSDDSSRGAALWDLTSKDSSPVRFLAGSGCIAFSPDGRTLAFGGRSMVSREGGTSGSVALFEVETGRKIVECRTPENGPAHPFGTTACLAFSPDGQLLASGGADTEALVEGTKGLNKNRASVRFWAVPSGKLLFSYDGALKQHLALAFSPDGKTLYVAGGNPFPTMKTGAVKLFDVQKQRERRSLVDMKYQVQSMGVSADGKSLVLASNNLEGDRDRAMMRQILARHRGDHRPQPAPARQHQDTFVEVWSLR